MLVKKSLLLTLAMAGTLCICTSIQAAPAPAETPNTQQPAEPPKTIKQAQKKMKSVLRALQQNRQSAEILLQAAKDSGASADAVKQMEQLTSSFRQLFMNAVSPQQLIDALVSDNQDSSQNLLIVGPDGSRWVVTPTNKEPMPAPPAPAQPMQQPTPPAQPMQPGMPPAYGMQPAPVPGMQPGVPPVPGMQPGVPPVPGMQPGMPPAYGMQPGMPPVYGIPQSMPPAFIPGNGPQPNMPDEVMIIEETIDRPYWPTQQDLGREGVMEYLKKLKQGQ